MAWPIRGTVSAEEILGMKPEELKSKLDSSATKDDLTALNTKFEEQGTTLKSIQDALAKLTKPPEPTPDPNIKADADDPTTQVLTDPAGFVNRATQGTQQVALQASADVQEMRARTKYGNVFARYGEDLLKQAQNYTLIQRSQPGFWDFLVRTYAGEKVLSGELRDGSFPSTLGSSSFVPNTDPGNDPNRGFTTDQASFFKERNLDIDKAEKIKKLMIDSGEPISLANFKGPVGHA